MNMLSFSLFFCIFAHAKESFVMNNDCLLSIIVPVYNVEKYIHACLESIFRQNLDENVFEVIIVNDGTRDHSMEVIQDIIVKHTNISIINQENLGVSVARNNGLAKARGEYILMPDSDDLLIDNSLPVLLEKAITSKADLIVADFIEMTDDEIDNLTTIPQKVLKVQEKTGQDLFLQDLNPHHCYVWRTLFRRDFLLDSKLRFVPSIRFQDVPFTHECYLKAKKCLRISWLLNIYRRGHESATYFFNMEKAKDYCVSIAETWKLNNNKDLPPVVLKKLNDDIFASFSSLIWLMVHCIRNSKDRDVIFSLLRREIPDLYFSNGLKQRATSLLFNYSPKLYFMVRRVFK
jgi:glycosyltransferase involved in cell wall biosynthesis